MRLPQQLPGPNAEMWAWQMHARCRGLDSAIFFGPDGERGHARAAREARAKAVCQTCPVIAECREHALAVVEPFGVWGGMSAAQRSRMLTVTDGECASA